MSINYFARHIGLPRGENLYQIKLGNNGISHDVADKITQKFPEIDKLWLLTGEGQMFGKPELRGVQIPFYNVDVEDNISVRESLKVDDVMVIPQLSACDFAMRYDGQAMGAQIPAGSTVLLKAVEKESIIPGAEYVIVSRKIVTLRIVRTVDDASQLRLVAGDSSRFDDIMLPCKEIKAVYKVVMKMIINK
ncbi:MAG: S24 family peptidase [Alistipes sp.]